MEQVAAEQLKLPGIAEPMPEHCPVKGRMHERTGPIDGKPYAIGFEMRLRTAWNGRSFIKATADSTASWRPPTAACSAAHRAATVLEGFAVLSSDAGHTLLRDQPNGGAVFGIDPQARLDCGYNAVAQLTPMAHALIRIYYGRPRCERGQSGSPGGVDAGTHAPVMCLSRGGALPRHRRPGKR